MTAPRLIIVPDPVEMGRLAADLLTETIARHPAAAIALPTGNTPLPLFAEIVARVERGTLDLSRAHVFCLDEYIGVAPDDPISLTGWLRRELLDRAGVPLARIHALPSLADDLNRACQEYEADLARLGGLEIAILGIGGNGHVAYNEPGTPADSRTREVALTPASVAGAAAYFPGRQVPTRALTVGIGTLLEARRLLLIATGEAKADILRHALVEPMSANVPASWLRLAGDRLTVVADEAAASACRELPWEAVPSESRLSASG